MATTGQAPILLGYSMGGRLALHAVASDPALWRALVLIGATPGLRDCAEREGRAREDAALADAMATLSIDAFLEHWRQKPVIRSQDNIPAAILGPLRERRCRNDPRRLAAALRGFSPGLLPDLWPALPGLDLPVLVLAGARDAKFARLGQTMASALPQGRFAAIPAAGHCAHLEQAEAFLALLRTFTASLPPA